jgi:hypothetical protein
MTPRFKLLNLALLGLGAGASGCVVQSGNSACTADLTMSWNVDEQGAGVTCDQAGADTVRVILDGVAVSFPCSSYGATLTGIDPGTHTAQLQLVGGGTVLSDTGPMNISMHSCITYDLNNGTPITFDVSPPTTCTANLQASWTIDENGTGAPLTCDQVPADTVDLILDGVDNTFSCSAYMGTVTGVPLGTHRAQLQLLNGGVVKSDTGAMNISVNSCITFDINGGTPIPFTVN